MLKNNLLQVYIIEMADYTNFKVSTDDVLGFNYEAYIADVRALALSNPSEYFRLRKVVMEKVRRDAVGSIYETFFNVLTAGEDKEGNPIDGFELNGDHARPCYPSDKVSLFAQKAAKHMTQFCNECVDIILPDDFEKLAERKLNIKGKANTIE